MSEEKPKVGRRRLLAGAGASGLAVAIAVFGRATAAQAYSYGCCGLAMAPNMTLSACQTSHGENEWWYTWYCALSNNRDCACCEHYRYGNIVGSAGLCYYS